MIGCDYDVQYEYHEIKDYDICCTCQYFYDNWHETRFECLKETQCDDCRECWEIGGNTK